MKRSAAVLGLFVLLSITMTWPLAPALDSSIPGDLGDPLLNSWILTRNQQKILAFDFSRFWEANIFYPSSLVLAFSEHLLVPTLLSLPVYALTGNPLVSYNLLMLLSFALSGWGAYLLARDLCGKDMPAVLAGVIFAFFPFRYHHLGHLHLLTSQWIPFVFLYLNRYLHQRKLRSLLLTGLFYLLQFLSCGYHGMYLSLFLIFFVLFHFIHQRSWPDRTCALQLLGLGLTATLVVLSVIWPYMTAKHKLGLYRPINDVIGGSADLLSYVHAPASNRLWGGLTESPGTEREALFPGLTTLALALLGARAIRKKPALTSLAPFAILLVVLAAMLSLGPILKINGKQTIPAPYGLIYPLPGFDGLRQVAVIGFFVFLALSILAGFGAATLKRRYQLLALALLLTEFWATPLAIHTVTPPPPVYDWLAQQKSEPMIEYPMSRDADYRYLYDSHRHGHDLVNGVSGYFPSWYWQAEQLMKRFPAPETLDFLESLGVKRVIVHGHQIAPIPGRLQVEHRVGRATVMRLVRTVSKSRQQAEAEWYRSPKVYQACDMRGLVGRIDGTARAARRGERGVLIYGPYVMLPAGRYEASFSIEGEYDRYRFGDLFGRVEISTYPMGILVAERPLLRSTLASGDLVVPFTLDERTQMRKLELRVLTTGVAALRVTRIRVRPVPAHR